MMNMQFGGATISQVIQRPFTGLEAMLKPYIQQHADRRGPDTDWFAMSVTEPQVGQSRVAFVTVDGEEAARVKKVRNDFLAADTHYQSAGRQKDRFEQQRADAIEACKNLAQKLYESAGGRGVLTDYLSIYDPVS